MIAPPIVGEKNISAPRPEPRVPDVDDLAGERDLAAARWRLAQLARKALGSSDFPQFAITDVVAHVPRVPSSRPASKPLGIA